MVTILGLLRVPPSPVHCKEVVTGSPSDLIKILAERTLLLLDPPCHEQRASILHGRLTGSKGDQQARFHKQMMFSNSTTHVRQRQENSP